MSTQKLTQEVASNALAIQSSGDTIITVGMKPEDVKAIIHSALETAMPMFAAAAKDTANKRMDELEEKVLEKLASQGTTSPEALKDPDFQYMLTRAHHAYARSGDPQIADTLVDLIGQRASQSDRSRLSLTLNDAVDKVALLTKNELAELSLVYTLRYTRRLRITNFASFLEWLDKSVLAFVPDISEEETSYLYLQAQSCAFINDLGASDLRSLLTTPYAGVLSNGFQKEQFESHSPERLRHLSSDPSLVIPCLHDKDRWQLNAIDKAKFLDVAGKKGFSESESTNVWSMFMGTVWGDTELVEKIDAHLPTFKKLHYLWSNTRLQNMTLTTTGIALGYANARRVGGLNADLSVWIK